MQDGYAVVASDGRGEYPIVTESRAGNDGVGVIVTPGTVAYVTTGGDLLQNEIHVHHIVKQNAYCLSLC